MWWLTLLLLIPPTLPLEVKPLSLPSFPDEETTFQPSTEVSFHKREKSRFFWDICRTLKLPLIILQGAPPFRPECGCPVLELTSETGNTLRSVLSQNASPSKQGTQHEFEIKGGEGESVAGQQVSESEFNLQRV